MKMCLRILSVALVATGSLAVTQRADAYQAPASETVVVTAPSAPVMRGNEVLGTVHAGQQLSVINRQNGWLGTNITVNGQVTSGWVWSGNVGSTPRMAYRRFSYQPDAVVPAGPGMGMQAAPPMTQSFAAPRSSGVSRGGSPSYMLPKSNPNRFRVR